MKSPWPITVEETFFGRFKIYAHLATGSIWLATFRYRKDAELYAKNYWGQ